MMKPQTEQRGSPFVAQKQTVGGISKNCTWKLSFLAAALCVLGAGTMALLFIILSFEWAPFTFMSEVFLLFFGLLMCVLDLPIPHPNPHILNIRFHIYRFFLFMTRFTGRGVWYCFLGSLVWLSLFDQNWSLGWISGILGLFLGLYPMLLGAFCGLYGSILSLKLNKVRKAILAQGTVPPCPELGLSKQQFGELAMKVSQTKFTDDQLDYVLNGLSWTPLNDGVLSHEEYMYWLQPGRMPIV